MKGKHYSREQILGLLRQADADLLKGQTVTQVCERLAISEETYRSWRDQFGGIKAEESNRVQELQVEDPRLKRAIAGLGVLGVFLLLGLARYLESLRPLLVAVVAVGVLGGLLLIAYLWQETLRDQEQGPPWTPRERVGQVVVFVVFLALLAVLVWWFFF